MKKIPNPASVYPVYSALLYWAVSHEPASQPQTSRFLRPICPPIANLRNLSTNPQTVSSLSERKPENQLEAVTIATTFPKYPVENIKEISFTINPEEKTERMRTNIDLEIEKNGIWYRIEPNHGTTGTAQESLSNTYYIDFLQWSKFDFPAGHYRVVLLPYQTQEEPWVAGEFCVGA